MANYKKIILKSDNISELTNDAGYITSGLANGTLVSGATYKQGTSSANDAQLWTNNQLRLNINGSGTTYMYGSLFLSGSRMISTQGGGDSLSINPNANLMLGSDLTDHIFIGNTGRNITMRGITTFSASTSGISYNDLSNKPSIFMHDYATVTGNPTFAGTTTFTGTTILNGATKVINSTPHLYVGDNDADNSGTWDANIQLDSHANARLRIQQRSDAKNLELFVHGGYEPLIQATDSATKLRLGVGGQVGLELDKYSVYLNFATYVQSLRANNSSGLITIYNQGYSSKGNLDLNNITGVESTFTTRVNTGQVRFTDNSKTSFNHLNVAQWATAYNWGNHASAGYLTAVPNALELKTSSGHIKFFDTDEGDTADYFRLEKDGGRMRLDFYDNSASASSNNIFMIGDDGQVNAGSFFAETQMAINNTAFNKTNILNWNTAYGWGNHADAGYLTSLNTANFTGNKVTFNGGEILADDGSAHYVKGGSALYLYRASADLAMSILSNGITSHKDIKVSGGLTVAPTEYDGDIKLGNTTYYSTIRQRASSTGKLEINQQGGTSTAKGIHFQINGEDALQINHNKTVTIQEKLYANNGLRILQLSSAVGKNSLMLASDGDVYTRELGNNAFTSYTDHSSAGYSTFSGSYDDLTNKPSLDANVVYNQVVNPSKVQIMSGDNRTKVSLWNGSTYGIGMHSAVSLGAVSDFAMTFQMNNQANRGFWWGHSSDVLSHGAMSLTTDGKLYVADQFQVGRGRGHTSALGSSYTAEFYGHTLITNGNLYIDGQSIGSSDVQNFKTAYGWGDHSSAGYSKFSGSYDDLSNKPSLDANIVLNQQISPSTVTVGDNLLMTNQKYIKWGGASGQSYIYGDNNNNVIHFSTNNTERVRIDDTGLISQGNVYINEANKGLYFGTSNNRIYFGSNRALEGGTALNIGESYTNLYYGNGSAIHLFYGNITVNNGQIHSGSGNNLQLVPNTGVASVSGQLRVSSHLTALANCYVASNLYTNSIQQNTAGTMTIGNGNNTVLIDTGQLDLRSSGDSPRLRFVDNNGTDCGSIYAHNGNQEIGFLDRVASWAYKHKHNSHHQWRINNVQRMYLDNYQMDVYCNQFKVEGTGTTSIIAKGDSNGYVNGEFVTSSKDGNRGGGLFMYDRGNDNEWFAGRPYSNSDAFIIARASGYGSHTGATATYANEKFKITNDSVVHTHIVSTNGIQLKGTNSYPRFYKSGDDAIIGTNTQNTALYIYDNGNARVVGSLTAYQGNSNEWNTAYGWGDHSKAGYQTKTSDIRLKTNISTIETPLDKISKLRGVKFDWKQNATNEPADTGGGVIAQEVEKVMPEFVHDIGNGSGMKTVDYNGLIGVLIESVKELKEQVNNCKCNCNCKGE